MRIEKAKEIRNNYKYSQAFRKPGWVDKQTRLGRMRHDLAATLKHVMAALESVYPGNWDIQFSIDYRTKRHTNQYTLYEFDEDWDEYMRYNIRRVIDGQIIYPTEEEFEAYLSANPHRRRGYLRDCYRPQVNTEFTVPTSFRIDSFIAYVHYPEVTVRNSRDQSITIRDLFVRFIFNSEGILDETPQASKTTFTTDEFESGHIQSHIPSLKMYNLDGSELKKTRLPFQYFCLGSGEVRIAINDYKEEPTQEDFEHVLHMMKTVVSWESLEGVPYARMENVTGKQMGALPIHIEHCHGVFKFLITQSTRLPTDLDWYYANGQYNLVDNEKLEDFIASAYTDRRITLDYLVHKDETGAYYTPNRITPIDMEPRELDFIVFQGKEYWLKVEGELRLSGERKKYINPNIKNYVKQRLELTANKIQIKADSITRLHQANNNKGISRQSEIPL